jgi:tetratricopeptide (TPR) repeat protein
MASTTGKKPSASGRKRPSRDDQATVERPVDALPEDEAVEGTSPDAVVPGQGASPEASPFEDTLSHGGPQRPAKPAAKAAAALPTGDAAWDSFEEGADRWLEMSQTGVFEPKPGVGGEATRYGSVAAVPTASAAEPRPAAAAPEAGVPASAPQPEPASAAPPVGPAIAQLVGLHGALAGQSFPIHGTEVRIGRASHNELAIPEPSMSREHARLSVVEGGFSLTDLGSGNGTFVDGKRIERARLQFGQEVSFGSVGFRFATPPAAPLAQVAAAPAAAAAAAADRRGFWARHRGGAAADAATLRPLDEGPPRPPTGPAWSPRLFGSWLGALLLVAICCGTLAFFVWRLRQLATQRQTYALLQQGISELVEHRFDAAAQYFNEAVRKNPAHVRLRHYQQVLPRERLAQSQLGEAHQAVAAGEWARAHALAQGILDSTYRTDAQAVLATISGEMEVRVARAQAAVDGGQFDAAVRLLEPVQAISSRRPEVAAILLKVDLQSRGSRLLAIDPAGANEPSVRAPRLQGRAAEAQRAFAEGNVDDALRLVDSLNSESGAGLRLKLEGFKEAYDVGRAEHLVKRAGPAIAALLQAKQLEAEISAGRSHLLVGINHRLADMYYVQGTGALGEGRLPEAYAAFRSGIEAEPDHAYNRRQLGELLGRAKQLFDSTQAETNPERRREILLTVLRITPAEAGIHRLAKQRLNN